MIARLIVVACCIAAVAVAAAQVDEDPRPTPVPFTAEPRQLQWRIGFDLGNVIILETPELNPENNAKAAVREAERLLRNPLLDFALALLPVQSVAFRTPQLVNPRQWTILDLHGKTERKTFQGLGVFLGRRLASSEGGFHLASFSALPGIAFVGVRKAPAPEDLIFGFAGRVKGKPQVHTKLFETKWDNLLPVEEPADFPAGYASVRQVLDDHPSDGDKRFLYGTSIEASNRNRVSKFWLLNYSNPDTSIGNHPWGIFLEEDSKLTPVYVYKPSNSADPYVAYFTAALDLDGNGDDEFVVEASYRAGTAFKVISKTGGKYEEIFSSYYRGPE